ncbi:hypothetical protein [Rhodococcus sp. NPDC049939]|uniref:hypothetical protein n=1 Tax=Rhodococcus sp. NPDC049939 TaxID=3155511 RepID=UPI0033FE2CD4
MPSTRRRISVLIAVPTMALAITGMTVGVAGAVGVNSDSAYQAQTQTVSMPVPLPNDLSNPFVVPVKYGHGNNGNGYYKNDDGNHFRFNRGYVGSFDGFQNNQF